MWTQLLSYIRAHPRDLAHAVIFLIGVAFALVGLVTANLGIAGFALACWGVVGIERA